MKLSKRQLLAIGAVAALAIAAASLMLANRTSPSPPASFDRFHLQCARCGQEFSLPFAQLPRTAEGEFLPQPGRGIDCPHCKAKHAVFRSMMCPGCGTWNLPPQTIDPESADRPESRCKSCNRQL